MKKKHKSNITFVIFTYNESKRIEYPIKCFLPYGKVVVIDNFSNDKTVQIASSMGATVYQYKNQGWVETKKESDFIFRHVKTDWVYWGFADTMIPKTCLKLYKKISQENKYKIVVQKLKTLLYNSHEYFNHINVTTRFFRKDSVDFSVNTVHQMGKFASHVKPAEILYLPPIDEYSLYHFSTHTTESIIANMIKYSVDQSTSQQLTFLKMILWSISLFIMTYFLNGGFRYGTEGFIVSVQYSFFYPFIIYSKTYEKRYNFTSQSIEKKFVKTKKRLLSVSPKSNVYQKLIAYLENAFISFLHIRYKFGQKK